MGGWQKRPGRVSEAGRFKRLEVESKSCPLRCGSGLGGRLRRDLGLLGPTVQELEWVARWLRTLFAPTVLISNLEAC